MAEEEEYNARRCEEETTARMLLHRGRHSTVGNAGSTLSGVKRQGAGNDRCPPQRPNMRT